MIDFCFYRQQRADGGVRTGLDIVGRSAWEDFHAVASEDEQDPALRWYVDVRGQGDAIPADRDELRDWLLQHAGIIEPALSWLAERFAVGFDTETWPVRWEVPNAPSGASMEIVISATRRVDSLEISNVLRELGQNWRRIINSIPRTMAVS